jgi:hydrogenase expression/formation protein HypC
MCLAIPAIIVNIEDGMGTVDMAGVQKKVSLILLEDAQVGDYVIVHAGFGIWTLRIQPDQTKLP